MCNYRGLTNVVISFQDDSIAEHLQTDPELMLDTAITIARQGEMLKK